MLSFLTFFALFVYSLAAMHPIRTYPVQRVDFDLSGQRISIPAPQPAGVYRVDRSDFPGASPIMLPYPYPYYYPAPQTQYWSPPRSYDYRNYEANRPNRPNRPIIPEPVISTSKNYPKLFIPASNQVFYAPKIVPIVTRKPTPLIPATTPDSDDDKDDDSVLPATRLSLDESEPLAALSANAKRVMTSKPPSKYYSYNDDVEINDEQRDLLAVSDYEAFPAHAKELPAQADRFRRQVMFVIDVPTENVDADEDTPLPPPHPNSVPSRVDLIADEFPSTHSLYGLTRSRTEIPQLHGDSPFSKNYLRDDEVMGVEDEFPKQYSTRIRTSSEVRAEETITTTPSPVVSSDEDAVVVFEAETEVLSYDDAPETTSIENDADVQLSLREFFAFLKSGPPSDDALAPEAVDELTSFIGVRQQLRASQPDGGVRRETEIGTYEKNEENLGERRESSTTEIEQEYTILSSAEKRDLIDQIVSGLKKGDDDEDTNIGNEESETTTGADGTDLVSLTSAEMRDLFEQIVFAPEEAGQMDKVYRGGGDDEDTNPGIGESETTTRVDGTDEVNPMTADICDEACLQKFSGRQFLLTLKNESILIDVLSPSQGDSGTLLDSTITTTVELTDGTSDLELVGVLRRLAEETDIIEKNSDKDDTFVLELLNRLTSTEASTKGDLKPEEKTVMYRAESLETTVPPTTTRSEVQELGADTEELLNAFSKLFANAEIPNDNSDLSAEILAEVEVSDHDVNQIQNNAPHETIEYDEIV